MDKANFENILKFKDRLKELRTEAELTQKQVAEIIGVKYQSYQAYELGISLPSLINLISLSKLFECSTDYLLGLKDY